MARDIDSETARRKRHRSRNWAASASGEGVGAMPCLRSVSATTRQSTLSVLARPKLPDLRSAQVTTGLMTETG